MRHNGELGDSNVELRKEIAKISGIIIILFVHLHKQDVEKSRRVLCARLRMSNTPLETWNSGWIYYYFSVYLMMGLGFAAGFGASTPRLCCCQSIHVGVRALGERVVVRRWRIGIKAPYELAADVT